MIHKIIFDENINFERFPNCIRTRLIAVLSLLISVITFASGLLVFFYMKSPNFEKQLLGQVMKHLEPIINMEIEKKFKERHLKLNHNNY